MVAFQVLLSCNNTNNKTPKGTVDTADHGYNELANSAGRKAFTRSEYNQDNMGSENIQRPTACTISTTLDTSLLFRIWTSDPNGPHADFVFSGVSFFVVDYEGDAAMPYVLSGSKLKIYYNDFIQEGNIVALNKDTLKIHWLGEDKATCYTLWKH
ncbi:hypothetical protein CJD36_002280 [Flavipsychrobacter stenotrophus]|uniref:Lipocalin-like domain-containing protein n=1 Tax=Flavipsychrobacter stenotrophus TaxID=2077091 RepID=A0A2S7T0V5_9BACT|nr:hypothetical protein CJD36_002280 [Flavipsychrobacter stenotrophus]